MNKTTLFLICLFLGPLGGHYFAIGNYKKGFLYLFTAGLLGFGWIYDLIQIAISDDFAKIIEEREKRTQELKNVGKLLLTNKS